MTKFATGSEIIEKLRQQRESRIHDDSRMQCKVCWHIYDPADGCPETQTPPGTPFKELPDWWTCPGCGNSKDVFLVLEES